MVVVALSCELATHGEQIAIELADLMDLVIVDEPALSERIATRLSDLAGELDCLQPEDGAGPDHIGQLCRGLVSGPAMLARHATAEIEELAAYGNVVLRGWGAPWVLRNAGHVVRVRLFAPDRYRIAVLREIDPKLDERACRRLIAESDAAPASSLGAGGPMAHRAFDGYHLKINTEEVPVPQAVALIAKTVAQHQARLFTVADAASS